MSDPRMITLTVSGLLFEFSSFTKWQNKGASWYANCGVAPRDTIAVDAVGRICRNGKGFMRARDEGTFPVKVYAI